MGKTMLRSISIFTSWPAQKCQKLQIRGLCWQLPIPLRMQRKMGPWPMHNKMLWAICSSNSLSKCNHFGPFWPFWAILIDLRSVFTPFVCLKIYETELYPLWNRVVPHFITNHQWLTYLDAILIQILYLF